MFIEFIDCALRQYWTSGNKNYPDKAEHVWNYPVKLAKASHKLYRQQNPARNSQGLPGTDTEPMTIITFLRRRVFLPRSVSSLLITEKKRSSPTSMNWHKSQGTQELSQKKQPNFQEHKNWAKRHGSVMFLLRMSMVAILNKIHQMNQGNNKT